jgi:hypothetical protein
MTPRNRVGLTVCFLKQQEPLLLLRRVKKSNGYRLGHTEVIQFWMLAIGHFAKFKKISAKWRLQYRKLSFNVKVRGRR